MNRHLLSTVSALACLLPFGCVSTGELNQALAKVRREHLRTVDTLEHRIADLRGQLNDVRTTSLQAIQEEAIVRGQESQTLREDVDKTATALASQLATESHKRAQETSTLEDQIASARRDLLARMDVEAMARVEEQGQLLQKAAESERAITKRIEAIQETRPKDRQQVVEAIAQLNRDMTDRIETVQHDRDAALAQLDRDMTDRIVAVRRDRDAAFAQLDRDTTDRIGAVQRDRGVALAQLGEDLRDLRHQVDISIADALRTVEKSEGALRTDLEEGRRAIHAEVAGEAGARIVQADAIVKMLDHRHADFNAKLNELGLRLESLRKQSDANHFAQAARDHKTPDAATAPKTKPASQAGAAADATGP